MQSYSNGPAHAEGFEAQYQQQLTFLPAPFNGFGYSGNITLVDSRAEIHPGIYGLLPSTSKRRGTPQFSTSARPSKSGSPPITSDRIYSLSAACLGNATDDYSSARLTMDLGSSYTIVRQVKVYFDAKNLLNTPLEFTEGTSQNRPIQREFYDITLLAGVRVSL